jgi:oligoribonuclease NrnB/cAMP/cGMP phosphodiesterase (DHH superfamily)
MNLVNAQNISQICHSHELVIMIDHHTSFKEFQKDVDNMEIKNLVYIFDEGSCASKLTLDFVERFFSFKNRFEPKFIADL